MCEDGTAYAAYAHEALLDSNPAQKESLLSVHQSLTDQGNGIDDRARCERDVHDNPDLQMAQFGTSKVPFYFDGTKCFYAVHRISDAEVEWKKKLGFAPDHVVAKTLSATTQLIPTVEAETRKIMRDLFQTRLPELKVRRVNNTCYVDTFFSSLPSVRGYTCWNLFCFRRTGLLI